MRFSNPDSKVKHSAQESGASALLQDQLSPGHLVPTFPPETVVGGAHGSHPISDEELVSILRGKLQREQLTAGVDALMAAASVLARKRATASHFGNGGEVANLLSEAKLRKERRRGEGSVESRRDFAFFRGWCRHEVERP